MKRKFRFDPEAALAHLRQSDPALAGLIDRVGPFTLELRRVQNLFEALLRSIIYQQLHGAAAGKIHERVVAVLAGHGGVTPEALLATDDSALRGAGMSQAKLRASRDLAEHCRSGIVPTLREAHRLADDELVARLTQVRGIGPWTVHMLLIFYLGRPDVLPTGDYAIRMGFKKLLGKRREPKPHHLIKHARRWQPYRSVASWYLWRSLD